jgi:hypothetical protein
LRLPRGDEAIVDPRKLTDYVLSPTHPRGRHKARVFESALRLAQKDADLLRTALLEAAAAHDAVPMVRDVYGQRYQIEFEFRFADRSATIVSAWLHSSDDEPPRLLTLFLR